VVTNETVVAKSTNRFAVTSRGVCAVGLDFVIPSVARDLLFSAGKSSFLA
jgi:hypothetical protein